MLAEIQKVLSVPFQPLPDFVLNSSEGHVHVYNDVWSMYFKHTSREIEKGSSYRELEANSLN